MLSRFFFCGCGPSLFHPPPVETVFDQGPRGVVTGKPARWSKAGRLSTIRSVPSAEGRESSAMRILRGLNSHQLPCGCLLGVYETYDGLVVRLFDAISDTCGNPGHGPGTLVPADAAETRLAVDQPDAGVRTRSSSTS